MQQYLSTPSVWKYGEGTGRYLHRRAISGIVPAPLVSRRVLSRCLDISEWLDER